jgi:large subunit ribosomal protein L4
MATKTKRVDVELPSEIFDVQVNIPLIHQVVVAQQAAARQGTHATKTRGIVRGGGRKPYKQKGTGRARQGSIRAPQFVGGGVVHGPQPRSYDQRTPKKMKAAALRGALTDRARNERIHVVESLVTGAKPSTKAALAALVDLSAGRSRFLVVLQRSDAVTWLSLRNAPDVHIVAVDQLNTYDVLAADDVVFTQGAYEAFVSGSAKSSDEKWTLTKAPADDTADDTVTEAPKKTAKKAESDEVVETEAVDAEVVEDEKPVLPTGAKAPLKSGKAPKGYEVKAAEATTSFVEPDAEAYDETTADFYFKSVEDAEAAGFTRAAEGSDK